MLRTRCPIIAALSCVLAFTAAAAAHEGPVYNYPLTVDDVTITSHSRSIVCSEDGSQVIAIRQKLTINSERGAALFKPPAVSWRAGSATAWLLGVSVRRDGTTVFHLGPRPDGPQLPLQPLESEEGPMQTAQVPLPELQAGDVIDWEVELRRKPLIEGQVFAQMNWSLRHPVEQGRFSVQVPRDVALQTRSWGSVSEPLVVPEGDHLTWLWRVDGRIDPVTPARGEVLPQTIVSSAQSWDVVGEWLRERITITGGELGEDEGADLLASVANLPHERRVQRIFDRVRNGLALPHAAPWYDAYTPRPPHAVLESGIGDCKDRAWLIFRALEEAGLTPYLAVAGLSLGAPSLVEQPPTPLLFDHVLVGVSGPGRTIWMDPTGAAEERMDAGRRVDALVLDVNRHALVTIDTLRRPTG